MLITLSLLMLYLGITGDAIYVKRTQLLAIRNYDDLELWDLKHGTRCKIQTPPGFVAKEKRFVGDDTSDGGFILCQVYEDATFPEALLCFEYRKACNGWKEVNVKMAPSDIYQPLARMGLIDVHTSSIIGPGRVAFLVRTHAPVEHANMYFIMIYHTQNSSFVFQEWVNLGYESEVLVNSLREDLLHIHATGTGNAFSVAATNVPHSFNFTHNLRILRYYIPPELYDQHLIRTAGVLIDGKIKYYAEWIHEQSLRYAYINEQNPALDPPFRELLIRPHFDIGSEFVPLQEEHFGFFRTEGDYDQFYVNFASGNYPNFTKLALARLRAGEYKKFKYIRAVEDDIVSCLGEKMDLTSDPNYLSIRVKPCNRANYRWLDTLISIQMTLFIVHDLFVRQ